MEPGCSAFEREVVNIRPPPFRNANIFSIGRNGIPRFGFSSRIENTLNGDVNQTASYLTGMVVCSLCIFSFFLCWIISLIIMKCLGPTRVGIYSGAKTNMVSQSGPIEPDELLQESNHQESSNVTHIFEQTDFDTLVDDPLTTEEKRYNHLSKTESLPEAAFYIENDNNSEILSSQKAAECEATTIRKTDTQLRRVRFVVLASGCVVVAAVITMIVAGIMNLNDASHDIKEGLSKAEQLALSGGVLIQNFLNSQNNFISDLQVYRAVANDFCPQLSSHICETLSPMSNCNFGNFSDTVASYLSEIYIDLSTYLFFELTSVQKDLNNFAETINGYQDDLQKFTWAFWIACVWALLLMIFTVFLMYGVILAWRGVREKTFRQCVVMWMQHWLVLPVYITLVILTWIFSMIFVIGTVLSADFCYNSPDSKILTAIEAHEDTISALAAEFTKYYVNGCPDSGLPSDLKDKSDQLLSLLAAISNFDNVLESEQITQICGNTSAVTAIGETVEQSLCNVANTLLDVQEYFACQNFHPVYESTVYKGVCFEGNRGMTFVAFTQILIVFFSMIILMFRVAFTDNGDTTMKTSTSTSSSWSCFSNLLCLRRKTDNDDERNEDVEDKEDISGDKAQSSQ